MSLYIVHLRLISRTVKVTVVKGKSDESRRRKTSSLTGLWPYDSGVAKWDFQRLFSSYRLPIHWLSIPLRLFLLSKDFGFQKSELRLLI
jgi:hypothetical protein